MNNCLENNGDAPRMDRRTRRTRRLLKDALLSLILEKGYDAVTIEEITERADLGRTTFYLHYKDKEDLLLKSIEAISCELLSQISNTPPILLVFQHAAENADLYRIILRGEGAYRATNWLQEIISDSAQNFMVMKQAQDNLDTYADANNQEKEYPIKAALYNLKGLIMQAQGNKTEARKYFNEALAIAPEFPLAKENLQKLGE